MRRHDVPLVLLFFLVGLAFAQPQAEHDWCRDVLDKEDPISCINETVPCVKGPCFKLVVKNYEQWRLDEEDLDDFDTRLGRDDGASLVKLNKLPTCTWNSTKVSDSVLTVDVQELSIHGYRCPDAESFLVTLLTEMPSLHDVYWQSSCIPSTDFLDTMESLYPSARLHYTYSQGYWHNRQNWKQLPGPLKDRSSLHSLKAAINYGGEEEPHHMRTLERLITAAPNLKEFSLTLGSGGCLRADEQPYAFDFVSLREGQRYPPLETIKLSAYDFDAIADGDWANEDRCRMSVEDTAWKQVHRKLVTFLIWVESKLRRNSYAPYGYEPELDHRFAQLRTCQIPKEDRIPNIEKWLKHMDWSRVRDLTINASFRPPSSRALNLLAGHLPSLQKLTLRTIPITDVVDLLGNLTIPLRFLTLLDPTSAPGSAANDTARNIADLNHLYRTIQEEHAQDLESLTMWSHEDCIMTSSCYDSDLDSYCRRSAGGLLSPFNSNGTDSEWNMTDFARLQRLDIDISRSMNGSEILPQENIEFLASAPNLIELTLRFPSLNCVSEPGNYSLLPDWEWMSSSPRRNTSMPTADDGKLFNTETITKLFQSFRAAQQNKGFTRFDVPANETSGAHKDLVTTVQPLLRKFEVYVGDWDWQEWYFKLDSMFGAPDPPEMQIGHWKCVTLPTRSRNLVHPKGSNPVNGDSTLADCNPFEEVHCEGDLIRPKLPW